MRDAPIGQSRKRPQGLLWLVVLFMATRIRVKLNGSDAGKVLIVQDGWGLPDLIKAAKEKLLSAAEAEAVDDSKVKLWLEGNDELDDIGGLEKDDVVYVALTGSGFKSKVRQTPCEG